MAGPGGDHKQENERSGRDRICPLFKDRGKESIIRRIRHPLDGADPGHRKGIQERDRLDHKARRIRADSG